MLGQKLVSRNFVKLFDISFERRMSFLIPKVRKIVSRRYTVGKMPQSSTAGCESEGRGAGVDHEHPVEFRRM